ncbi:hypothetical protein BJ165DRAFT_274973 [Panaeolus papilionaceus]|nr:hypothetical protein BJ165DRAFT_274973 [Panaeolus papilionaceus]
MDMSIRSDGDPDRQRFALDIWEIIISFILDEHRTTLISLSYVSRDLCITLRRRLFAKVTFLLSHKPSHPPQFQLAEPFRSPAAKLLPILKSNPGLSEYIRHLEIQTIPNLSGDIPHVKEVGYYEDFSLPKLVPYLINLDSLSFTTQPSTTTVRWSTLPELIRETTLRLLSIVSNLMAPDLYDLPSSAIFDSRSTALRTLSVGMYGLFIDGKRFSADVLRSTSPGLIDDIYSTRQTRIRSLTVDSRCDYHHWNPFPHWLMFDNPLFPISINYLEDLSFVQRQHIIGPKHGFQRILRRCANTLRSLRLPPGYSIEEAMRGKLTWKASQRMHYKGEVPNLSVLTNLQSCRMAVFIRFSGEDYFTTTLPCAIKTLKTLPNHNTKTSLEELWIDLYLESFEDHLVKQLDWSQFVDFVLHSGQFSQLERVILEVVCLSSGGSARRSPLAGRMEPSASIMDALRGNTSLRRLVDRELLHVIPG